MARTRQYPNAPEPDSNTSAALEERRIVSGGCFIFIKQVRKYIPQVRLDAHATILSSSSRTTLTQTFVNPSTTSVLENVRYVFPLYDGVSVVAFSCTIGSRVIHGTVRERQKAKQVFAAAVDRGETAGLLEQSVTEADVFTTSLGNVPAGESIVVRITYLGELKHDAELDGLRFTIPTSIAPRYGSGGSHTSTNTRISPAVEARPDGAITITVDVDLADARSAITSIQSPSHPISVGIGTTTTSAGEPPSLQRASASLALGSCELEKDFVVHVVATNLGNPTAMLETHPTMPNHRALMATLVPKFTIPADKPEIVFVCDRSGSMSEGGKIPNLVSALQIFLKSLPVGVKFNICSFGTAHDFLWPRSRTYDEESLDDAVSYVAGIRANYGGTKIYEPVEDAFKRRYSDMNLDLFLLTDGEISDQQSLFRLINENVDQTNGAIRVFTLGIGNNVSHALIEGVARSGNGFSQAVGDDEKMDKKVIRMLKGALTPHIKDYALSIKYSGESDEGDGDDFEMVEMVESLSITPDNEKGQAGSKPGTVVTPQPISLFDSNLDDDHDMPDAGPSVESKYDHLPALAAPRYLQSPSRIPPLFPFNRTTVYVLLSDSAPQRKAKSIVLRGTSTHGPLELEIPITSLPTKGTTVHQLAARKAIKELEEGRGWIADAKDADGKLLKDKHEGHFSDMVEREAVRLGVEYQVGGKWCSFVAVEEHGEGEGEGSALGEMEVLQARPVSRFGSSNARMGFSMAARASNSSAAPRKQLASKAARKSCPSPAAPVKVSRAAMRKCVPSTAPKPVESDAGGAERSISYVETTSSEGSSRRSSGRILGAPPKEYPAQPGQSTGSQSRTPDSEPGNPLSALAALQTFVGSWTWSASLEQVIGATKQQAMGLRLPAQHDNHADVVATICAVVYLKKKLPEERDAWEMLVDKAEAWLVQQTGVTQRTWRELQRDCFTMLYDS